MQRSFQTPCPFINIMSRALFKASRSLLRDFGEIENLQTSQKKIEPFLVAARERATKKVQYELTHFYPECVVYVGNQSLDKTQDAQVFILNVLDGDVNFLHGLSHFCMSLGVMQEGEMLAAVVFDPVRDELFWASQEKGAFVGRRRLRVAHGGGKSSFLLALSAKDACHGFVSSLKESVHKRVSGSLMLDLAYVAAGRLDGVWASRPQTLLSKPGLFLVEEAQGCVSSNDDMFAKKGFMAAAGVLCFEKLSSALKAFSLPQSLEDKPPHLSTGHDKES